ncbi:MAG: AbrB/MazE/SpoVT family DNA-binding domain-containing protein [Bryobacterales bacterium]|nr:AbrB/MazE/SpoVT family DNA-binding domain-containing protein [Bryobacterales bacterium]MBV9397259.1 AbrB/MazE/SpoVT family DNA-binding domain-containing protein [Bryobacterales bacterium]
METVTVSSKGQIAIPKNIRQALNLNEGTKLTLDVQGHRIVLTKDPAWKKLAGSVKGLDLIKAYRTFKKRERKIEDSRP